MLYGETTDQILKSFVNYFFMNQWYLCYFQHILQSHPGIVFIGGFFYSRYESNTQIKFYLWQIKFYLWHCYWSYDLNDTCLTKIESQNLILCVFIEFKISSVKSCFPFFPPVHHCPA